jgi:hypothetical protein
LHAGAISLGVRRAPTRGRKFDRAETFFERQPAAQQVEILPNESGVVNISTSPMLAA